MIFLVIRWEVTLFSLRCQTLQAVRASRLAIKTQHILFFLCKLRHQSWYIHLKFFILSPSQINPHDGSPALRSSNWIPPHNKIPYHPLPHGNESLNETSLKKNLYNHSSLGLHSSTPIYHSHFSPTSLTTSTPTLPRVRTQFQMAHVLQKSESENVISLGNYFSRGNDTSFECVGPSRVDKVEHSGSPGRVELWEVIKNSRVLASMMQNDTRLVWTSGINDMFFLSWSIFLRQSIGNCHVFSLFFFLHQFELVVAAGQVCRCLSFLWFINLKPLQEKGAKSGIITRYISVH